MTILDLFSKRQRRRRGEVPDVWTYDALPKSLRVQLVHIFGDLLGKEEELYANGPQQAFKTLVDALCREYGVFRLHGNSYEERQYPAELFNFVLATEDAEQVLDVVEVVARYADRAARNFGYMHAQNATDRVSRGLEELNHRFREHGVGFQYEDGELVRVDSDLIHAEAVKPALMLLRTKQFAGPRQEFLDAYDHYRHSRHADALTAASKSFESTMKAICDTKGWSYDPNATAKKLVNVCFSNGLVDQFWQTHITALQSTLENGIGTARNKLGGHGQGAQPREVPRELVAYVLHITASTIVFLIESADA